MTNVDALFDWLVDGAPGAATAADIVGRVGSELFAAGVPIHRIGAFVMTLHPNVLGRAFIWEAGKPVVMNPLTLQQRQQATVWHSPIRHAFDEGQEWRWRAGEPDGDYGIIKDLIAAGGVDYIVIPVVFTNGERHAISLSSRVGFTDDNVAAMRHVLRPLARITEIYALRRTAANILDTYVGALSGERVLAGRIGRGDVETIRAVIWFSDMRGFTALSARTPAKQMIAILNDVFECQVPAIQQRGGEVLKFIGDGLLAIFPISDAAPARGRCAAALDAASETFARLAEHNARAATDLQIGLALHIGDVEYGNIGGSARLDFTAIGGAVNLAARLEGIASKVGRSLVVSADFAAVAERAFDDLGEFELKGISGPQRVFGTPP